MLAQPMRHAQAIRRVSGIEAELPHDLDILVHYAKDAAPCGLLELNLSGSVDDHVNEVARYGVGAERGAELPRSSIHE